MTTEIYNTYVDWAIDIDDDNYCVPIAFAIATGIEYGKMVWVFERLGRNLGKGTSKIVSERVMDRLSYAGFCFVPETFDKKRRNLCNSFKHVMGNYIIYARRHAVSVTNGTVHDYKEKPIYIPKHVIRVFRPNIFNYESFLHSQIP